MRRPIVSKSERSGTGVDMANLSKAVCHGESDKCRFGNPPQESNFQRLGIIDADPRFAQAMGVKGLARAAFPANEKTDVNSFVIVPLPLNIWLGGPNAKPYSFDLVYDTTTTEVQVGSKDVVTTKTNAAVAKYPVVENCKELALK